MTALRAGSAAEAMEENLGWLPILAMRDAMVTRRLSVKLALRASGHQPSRSSATASSAALYLHKYKRIMVLMLGLGVRVHSKKLKALGAGAEGLVSDVVGGLIPEGRFAAVEVADSVHDVGVKGEAEVVHDVE